MKTVFYASIFTLISVASMTQISPAAAQEFVASVDENEIGNCFSDTERGETASACIGEGAAVCMDQAGGQTTRGISDCLQAETTVWDEILNAEYGARRGEAEANVQAALKTAQRAWIAYRDAECALAYERFAGGSIASNIHAACMMEQTAARALELRDMGEDS